MIAFGFAVGIANPAVGLKDGQEDGETVGVLLVGADVGTGVGRTVGEAVEGITVGIDVGLNRLITEFGADVGKEKKRGALVGRHVGLPTLNTLLVCPRLITFGSFLPCAETDTAPTAARVGGLRIQCPGSARSSTRMDVNNRVQKSIPAR
jgi:hypothetical protein